MIARGWVRFDWGVVVALWLACGAGVAAAQRAAPTTAPATTAGPAAATPTSTPAKAARTAAPKSARRTGAAHAGANTAPKSSPRPAAGTAAPKDGAPRRLTDVHIEGEMPVPQVLFITARDQRRYVDFQHQRYLRDSRALGAATATPTRVTAAGDDTHH